MIVVQMVGGMGNHMFQYALLKRMSENNEVFYETSETKKFYKYYKGFELNDIFNISQGSELNDFSVINKLERFQENTWPRFNPAVLDKKDTYLCGNWQNIGYFPKEEELRKEYTFKRELDVKNKEILKQIEDSESVAIHIRKQDYTKNPGYFFQADWMNYYGMAVSRIAAKTSSKPSFFVFSDDIEWCKKSLFIKATFVSNVGYENVWKDLLLMSKCKHIITANSTFSWWAAWLNANPNKIVTTPKQWFLDRSVDSNNITLDNWIKI
jgi:hypothetical protein